jgi:hypothetical protein
MMPTSSPSPDTSNATPSAPTSSPKPNSGPGPAFIIAFIAVDDLLQEQCDGGGRVEFPVAPLVAVLAAESLDGLPIENVQGIVLDALQSLCDTDHPWPPVGWWF